MDFEDQFARAFDYSGIAPLYSDLFYTAMATSLALGGLSVSRAQLYISRLYSRLLGLLNLCTVRYTSCIFDSRASNPECLDVKAD